MTKGQGNAWRTARGNLTLGPRTLVMGILNCTPDSFSDGGQFLDPAAAVAHGLDMARQGADIIDVGGESTRPGSRPVAPDEQIRRTVPVIKQLAAETDAAISIDTQSTDVARAALRAGAAIVNDVSSLRCDPEMAAVVAESGAGVVLMHMLGKPRTMQSKPKYDDVADEVAAFLVLRVAHCQLSGIESDQVVIDPGIGFGKTLEHNLTLLRRLDDLVELGLPVLVGPSRKRFIGQILDAEVDDRLAGTLAAVSWAVTCGAAIVRVHDVLPARQTVEMLSAIEYGQEL